MDIIHDFDSVINSVLDSCFARVSSYPEKVRPLGLEYMEKLNLVKEKPRTAAFSYLLPFWLKDAFHLDEKTCKTISIGNIFGLLYFMSQDEVIDNPSNIGLNQLLPLSTLFFNDFLNSYRILFSGTSPFWRHLDSYLKEWAESVTWELLEHRDKITSYSEEDFILLSRKAAPLKIPFAAICILSSQENHIKDFCEMIDYDIAAYQMIDDWKDWREDLGNKNYSLFLTRAIEYSNITDPSTLSEDDVLKAIYDGNIWKPIYEKAKSYCHRSAKCVTKVNSAYLKEYLRLEQLQCDEIMTSIDSFRSNTLKGGIENLLWKLTEKP